MIRMRTLLLATAVALLVAAAPAGAVIGGQPDGDAHPYVGIVFEPVSGAFCSGVLVSPTTFVTAAHCFPRSQETVLVTFERHPALGGWVSGTWHPHEGFCMGCARGLPGFATADVAVVELHAPVEGIRTASLPAPGLADTLRRTPLTVVGYGVQWFEPGPIFSEQGNLIFPQTPASTFERTSATVSLVPSNHAWRDEFLRISASKARVCYGDSGGPNLVGDTVVAINSYAGQMCSGNTYSYRLDTAAALEFIGRFVP